MQTFYATALLAVSIRAIDMQTMYARGDAQANGYDPENFGDYDSVTGRNDQSGETGLQENVLEYNSALNEDERTRPLCSIGGILGTADA